MTLRTRTFPTFHTDVTGYKAFCQMVHDNLAATGMTQTGDSGQLSITGIAARPGAGAVSGYEVWQFTDSLQSVSPIYVKVEYGAGATINNPNLWITVGTGSDGAGNLTYTAWPGATSVIARRSLHSGGTSANGVQTTRNVYFTYLADQSWALLFWPSNAPDEVGVWFYVIERYRNADGSASADGVNTFYAGVSRDQNTNKCMQDSRLYAMGSNQTTSIVENNWLCVNAYNLGTPGTLLANKVYPTPVFTGFAPRVASPSQFVVALGATDVQGDAQFAMDHYGATHTWVGAGSGYSGAGFGNLSTPNANFRSFAMRID